MTSPKGVFNLRSLVEHLAGRSPQVAGAFLFAAGVIAFMGIITAETLYPGYSTSDNMISDLGATDPPDSIIEQPSSNIFSGTMMVTGILVIASSYYIHRTFGNRAFSIPVALFGTGALGVGVFNGSWGDIHALFALTTFVAGAVAAILTYKVLGPPLSYFSFALGLISLATLVQYFALGDSSPLMEMGEGGIERWIAYPIVVWTMGIGGHLMNRSGAHPMHAENTAE